MKVKINDWIFGTSIFILLFATMLSGCVKNSLEKSQTDNLNIQVKKLFTKDGCTVYRFLDGTGYIYYARCESGKVSTQWRRSCGKGCTRLMWINTEEI